MGQPAPQLNPAPAAAPPKAKGCPTAQAVHDLPALMAEQNELLTTLISEFRETNRFLQMEKFGWISGDDAARMLGKTVSKSGWHLRVLTHCRKEGLLTRIGQGSNITYWYEEVKQLQQKVAENKIVLP